MLLRRAPSPGQTKCSDLHRITITSYSPKRSYPLHSTSQRVPKLWNLLVREISILIKLNRRGLCVDVGFKTKGRVLFVLHSRVTEAFVRSITPPVLADENVAEDKRTDGARDHGHDDGDPRRVVLGL